MHYKIIYSTRTIYIRNHSSNERGFFIDNVPVIMHRSCTIMPVHHHGQWSPPQHRFLKWKFFTNLWLILSDFSAGATMQQHIVPFEMWAQKTFTVIKVAKIFIEFFS